MPPKGIRLSDLYGSDEYKNWIGNNKETVEYTIEQHPKAKPDNVRGHLYMDAKIKEAIGDSEFGKLPKMGLQEKIDWYNNNIIGNASSEEPSEEVESMMPQIDSVKPKNIPVQQGPVEDVSAYQVPTGGATIRDWFRDNAGGDYTAYANAKKEAREAEQKRQTAEGMAQFAGVWGGAAYKSEETQQLEDEINTVKETNPDNTAGIKFLQNALKVSRTKDIQKTQEAIDGLFKEAEVSDAITEGSAYYDRVDPKQWKNPSTEIKIDALKQDLRNRLDNDGTFAFDMFKQFEDEMNEYVPQYRNYHDTLLALTPDEMKDIMSEYYSLRQIKNENEALNFASAMFQDRLAERQSIADKAAISIKQAGANFAGMTIATAGIVANSANALLWASQQQNDIEDLGWFKEFLYYAASNPWTEYGNRIQTTGVWNTDLQKTYEEIGFNALQLQRQSGNETKFWDINTPFELFSQGAYTVAGMATGTATAQILANSVGRTATSMATRLLSEGAKRGTRFISRAVNVAGKSLVTAGTAYLPAAAEASMDAMETYRLAHDNAEESVLLGLRDQLAREQADGTYEMWYQQNTQIPYDFSTEVGMSDEQIKQLAQLRQQERAYLWDTYQNLRVQEVLGNPEVKRDIEMAAQRASAKNLYDESTWIAFGDAMLSNSLGRAFRETKKGVVRAIKGADGTGKFKWVPEGNHFRPVAKEIKFGDRVAAIGKGLVESGEEGFEELFQTVDSKMRQDLNKHMIAEYIQNRYDPDATGQATDRMYQHWDIVGKSLGENLLSDEALYSFALGAVSSGLGSPTVFRGVRTGIDVGRKEGLKQGFKEGLKASWRNPLAENWREVDVKHLQDQQEANELNKWMSAHPEVANMNDEVAILRFLNNQSTAAANGDEATYRDALMGQKVATMMMLERANPDGAKINFYERLKQISKVTASDAEARDLVSQVLTLQGKEDIVRTEEGPLNEEELKVLDEAKNEAKKLLDMRENMKLQMSILDSQFGNSISNESKEALAYSLLMQDDWTNRINTITDQAIKAYNEANPDKPVAPIAEEQKAVKNAIARFGTKENAQAEQQRLKKERLALNQRKHSMYKYEYRAAIDKNLQQSREAAAAEKLLSSAEEGTVITAEEILSLDNKARAYLLDKANRGQYSAAQQGEINKFVTSEGVYNQTIDDLIDAGRLQNKKEYFKNEYDALQKNNGALIPIFDREIRKEASKKWVTAKLGTALDATTYAQFKEAMDKAMLTGDFTDADKFTMSEVFNDPANGNENTKKFYDQYRKDEMVRSTVRGIIENSPEFKNLNEDQKNIVSRAVEDAQREGSGVNSNSIIAKLSNADWVNQLERQGINVSSLRDATTLEELAAAVDKVMKQKGTYDRNVADLKAVTEKKKATDDASSTPNPQNSKPKTAISKEKVEANKEKVQAIFNKIAASVARGKNPNLTKSEFIELINLFSTEDIGDNLIVDDINTALTDSAFSETIQKLTKATEDKAYLQEDAVKTEEYMNTVRLVATLSDMLKSIGFLKQGGVKTGIPTLIKNSILEIDPAMAVAFREVKKKDLPKKITFNGKTEKGLTTQTEKTWYADNHITENISTLMGLNAAKVDYVFIKDSALATALKNELGEELNDDNLPLVIAARVPLKTKGSVLGADGHNYLYVGLLENSRKMPAAEDRNDINTLRAVAMEQENDGPIMNNGNAYVSSWAAPKMSAQTQDKTETTSLRDWLEDKYKDIKNDAERKKAMIDDFIAHYRHFATTTKNGEVSGTFEWPGKPNGVRVSWATTGPDEDSRDRAAYIRENPDGSLTPLFLEIRSIDEVDFDEGMSMYEALNSPEVNIASPKYERNDGNYIRKTIVAVGNLINGNKALITSGRKRKQVLDKLNKDIQKSVERYLNLRRPANFKDSDIQLGLNVDANGNLQFTSWEVGAEESGSSEYGIPAVLSSMPLEGITEGSEEEIKNRIFALVQEGIKNLIFDENGNIRTADTQHNGKQWPVIKFEDNYRRNDTSAKKVFSRDDVKLKLFGNIWQTRTYALKQQPEAVAVAPVNQSPQSPVSYTPSANAQEEAIRRITVSDYIDTSEGKHFKVGPNEMEVTSFISAGEDEINWDDNSLSGQLATNLGTSVDKLYRVWRQSKTREGVQKFIDDKKLGSWPGLSKFEVEDMLKQFERIDKFFAARDEVQIDADLIFRATVEYDGKYKSLVGKPDIITVDKHGRYHIYDMKSFRYQSGATAQAPGFNSLSFTINGLRNFEKKSDKWRQQMSLYKAMIESKLGKGTVSEEIGVIPIRLGYKIEGSIDPNNEVFQAVGAYKLKDNNGKPMHLSFQAAPLEKAPTGGPEPITRCYDDAIHMQAITKLTDINPEGWKTAGSREEARSKMEEIKQEAKGGTTVKEESPVAANPEIIDTVNIYQPLNETSSDALLEELGGENSDVDPFDSALGEQLLNDGVCNGNH